MASGAILLTSKFLTVLKTDTYDFSNIFLQNWSRKLLGQTLPEIMTKYGSQTQ